jgi:cytochrome c oxidase subunit II
MNCFAPRKRALLAAGPLLALLLAGCTEVPATQQAEQVHSLYQVIFLLAAPVVVVVEALLLWFIFRYRRQRDGEPPQSQGTRRALIVFFLIPTVIVATDYVFGEKTLASIQRQDPNPQVVIRVDGFQWEWTFYYLNEGFFTTGKTLTQPAQLEIPVDEPVHVLLHSRDVIHSFFIPSFLFKRDVIPGRTNSFTFTGTKIGVFEGQCAEFCGLHHAQMTFFVHVVTPSDYVTWVKRAREAALNVTCPSTGTTVRISAKNTSWSTNCISVAPNQPIALTVANNDAGIDHNFAVYDSPKLGRKFFQTGRFPGDSTKSFQIAALPPGKYYFQCDVHGPAMSGVFIVNK